MSDASANPKHGVLVTGSSGHVGRTVVAALREAGHAVHGLDLVPSGGVERETVGNMADAAIWDQALLQTGQAKIDTLVHLAANPYQSMEFLAHQLEPNVVGMYQAFEAAARHGVRRLVFASTLQVVSGLGKDPEAWPISTEAQAPTNMYAAAKCMGEQMGRYYVDQGRIASVVVARIGWFVRDQSEHDRIVEGGYRQAGTFVSHRDLSRFFVRAVEAEHTGYGSYWCMSAGIPLTSATSPGVSLYDLQPGRNDLDFHPTDRFPEGIDWLTPTKHQELSP